MTLINSRDLIPLSKSEIEARDPLVLHAKRKAELKSEQERWERRRRPKLDVRPMTPAEVDQRVAADQQVQDEAIGRVIGELRAEFEREISELREQVAELSKELSFTKGLLHGSSGATRRAARDEHDWSGWEKWLQGHLAIERAALTDEFIETCGYALGVKSAELRADLLAEIKALELQLDALKTELKRLPAGPPGPPDKMSPVKTWQPDTVFYKGEIATHRGATYQAQCDTAKAPWTEDWALLAAAGAPGKNPVMRGTYNPAAEYSQLDCVALNGSTFIALRDAAGACPGAHWQLVASCGKRGPPGARGIMGLRGERGEAAPAIRSWEVDRARYVATPVMSDGSRGPPLELHALFEQFLLETSDA